ncbi:hypothetical protein [Janthinobacterium lividum]|uniref:CMP/dCMP-type deaminase domain-containing protein n=1 Tax=Janthinobacterium lividum TaxID=29581 RepID=A0ABU0XNC0_9BURK|nr:hypothetical protein [Janthinobacterium lividum]MDQ4624505.1 hypothetical protein [Janthinobacterium lividum]MDQ4673891.1 hypothetical protein [Janthinobacterium lividum]MDQ4684621.1 hypothetical protein [Janthinobacterium lividum]
MNNYLKSAISIIYGDNDDFILLGLTGRTGSGCSTVAEILQSDRNKINHSLIKDENPISNEDRKSKIIFSNFESTWRPFHLIQASAVLTLLFAEKESSEIREYITSLKILEENEIIKLIDILKSIHEKEKNVNESKEGASEFYTKDLPKICKEIKKEIGDNAFVKIYQSIGTNVRMSGDPTISKLIDGKFFTLAKKINEIIKKIRIENKEKKETQIVIDAIRSPLEAIFFQERYAAFFLVAVSCSDSDRKGRLRKLKYSEIDIKIIDEQEYKSRDINEHSAFSVQDIQACLQRADIYVSNPNEVNKVSEFKLLSNQLIRFITLMKRPGCITPTALERGMQVAYTAKLHSGCISRQVGAVITDSNFSIQAVGWNDTPYGQVPCILRNRFDMINGRDQKAYSEYEKTNIAYISHFKKNSEKYIEIKSGRNISFCFKSEYNSFKGKDNQVHTRALHAEENAFMQISKYGGRGIKDGFLFTTASPCELCAKKAYQLGIKNIYYIDPYPGIATEHVIESGSNKPNLVLFSGAIGIAFHRLYTPMVAYKDELNSLKLLADSNPISNAAFKNMHAAIAEIQDSDELEKIKFSLVYMEENYGTKKFIDGYVKFMELTKNHLPIIKDALPKITELLLS